ncbi:MAG: hypothetical protein P8J55_00560 [Pseudomonadales bacterium]|nr:hypothetical protein [Pseudomonadales bacterium]
MDRMLTIGLLVFVLAGCASTEQIERELDAFIGDHVTVAVEKLGRPDRKKDMQNGTVEYEWRSTKSRNASINTNVMGIPLPQSKPTVCKRVLVVDERKRVIGHTVEGC